MIYEPDRYFSRLSAIDIQRDVIDCGFTHVLLDVDNTLLTRDEHIVPTDCQAWLDKAREAGVQLCLLSNNFHKGVHELADRLGLPIVSHAVKPLPHGFIMARHKIGGTRTSTLMIGDQVITDVLGAHFVGMKAYLVGPLVEADLWHTLLLRKVERVLLRDAAPEPVPEGQVSFEFDASSEAPTPLEPEGSA